MGASNVEKRGEQGGGILFSDYRALTWNIAVRLQLWEHTNTAGLSPLSQALPWAVSGAAVTGIQISFF